jgi:hypothetical protein
MSRSNTRPIALPLELELASNWAKIAGLSFSEHCSSRLTSSTRRQLSSNLTKERRLVGSHLVIYLISDIYPLPSDLPNINHRRHPRMGLIDPTN